MKSSHLVAMAAALSLVSVSSAAIAQSVPAPATESVSGESQVKKPGWVVGLFALGAAITGAAFAFKKTKKPVSP